MANDVQHLLIIYSNCSTIPKDYLPEWFISASKTCLLPNLYYKPWKAELGIAKDPKSNSKKEEVMKQNIACSSHAKGGLLTCSFIAKSQECIKAYIYWNGQMSRFGAADIEKVFPRLFNMNWNNGTKQRNNSETLNEIFMNDQDKIQKLTSLIRKQLHDKQFQAFQQSC